MTFGFTQLFIYLIGVAVVGLILLVKYHWEDNWTEYLALKYWCIALFWVVSLPLVIVAKFGLLLNLVVFSIVKEIKARKK